MSYVVEAVREDGYTVLQGRNNIPKQYVTPQEADRAAEVLWLKFCCTGLYERFSVKHFVTGEVYSDWDC